MTATQLQFSPGHPSGMGGIGYALHDDKLTIVSCGQDGKIVLRKADDPAVISTTSQAEGAAGHCLALSNITKQIAIGDQGHFVKVQSAQPGSAPHTAPPPALPSCHTLASYTCSKAIYTVATGDMHRLQVYKLPQGEFDSVATRFSLPVRALAYSPSGTNLAAGGDDEGIKLISAAESKVHDTFDCRWEIM